VEEVSCEEMYVRMLNYVMMMDLSVSSKEMGVSGGIFTRNSKVVKSSGINYSVWEVICFCG